MRPPPKFDPPPAVPISTTSPPLSTATPLPTSLIAPPNAFDQTGSPAAVYFARKTSSPPALVSGPVPKSTVPLNFPVTSTLPFPSTATARPVPPPSTPPRHCDHTAGPGGAYGGSKTPLGRRTPPRPGGSLPSLRSVIP